jgi:hypothetical protein
MDHYDPSDPWETTRKRSAVGRYQELQADGHKEASPVITKRDRILRNSAATLQQNAE